MDAFGDFFDQLEILLGIVQFSIRVTQQLIKQALLDKLNNVIKLFNLSTDDKTQEELQIMLKPFLKNNYKDIFKDQSLLEKLLSEFYKEISCGYFDEDQCELIQEALQENKEAVSSYFAHLKNIVLYMQISEPQITLQEHQLSANSNDKLRFHKYYTDQFQIIDGFEKEGCPCLIILNQPKIGNGSFAGIKPAVIILSKLPPGYSEEDIIDLKATASTSTDHDMSISSFDFKTAKAQIKSVVAGTSASSVQIFKNVIQTPKVSKIDNVQEEATPLSTIKSSPKQPRVYSTPQIVLNIAKTQQQSQGKLIQNIVTNEEDNESSDCIDREMEEKFEQERSHIKIIEDPMIVSRTPMNEGIPSFLNTLSDLNQSQSQLKLTPQKQLSSLSRNHSQTQNITYGNNNLNRSFELVLKDNINQVHGGLIQSVTAKPSHRHTKQQQSSALISGKKVKNQSLYENLNQLERFNFQGSRFIKCSLNFTKYLRNMSSHSPDNQDKKANQATFKQTNANNNPNTLGQNAIDLTKSGMFKLQNLRSQIENPDSSNQDYDSLRYQQQQKTTEQNQLQQNTSNIKKKVAIVFEKRKDLESKIVNSHQQSISQHSYQNSVGVKQNANNSNRRQNILSASRVPQITSKASAKSKVPGMHERILKQGSVLKRKPSINHIGGSYQQKEHLKSISSQIQTKEENKNINICGSFKVSSQISVAKPQTTPKSGNWRQPPTLLQPKK